MHDIGYSCDITSSIEKSDQVGENFELAVVASMAFFKWKNADMYRLCNGNKNTTGISTIVGMKETNIQVNRTTKKNKKPLLIGLLLLLWWIIVSGMLRNHQNKPQNRESGTNL